MKVGTVLPHLLKFGGVRRFLEIGNGLVARGHDHLLAVTPGLPECGWMEYRGRIVNLEDLVSQSDCLLIGDPPSLKHVSRFPRNRLYVYVIAGGEYFAQYDPYYGHCPFLLNNRVFRQRYPSGKLLEGSVNTSVFRRRRLVKVGYYSGRGGIKGQSHIERELQGLPGVRLVPIQGIVPDDNLRAEYSKLDYFVVWEQRAGWSNTAAEALACGVPVVTNGTNVEPFRDRCIVVEDLRGFFTDPMGPWSWDSLVDGLVPILEEALCPHGC